MADTSLIISIDWPYALGIVGTLIWLAWMGSGRLTKVENDVSWLKKDVTGLKKTVEKIDSKIRELSIKLSNEEEQFFGTNSPIKLNPEGQKILHESGLQKYIDTHKEEFIKTCEEKRSSNSYEVQQHIFNMFDSIEFESEFDNKVKEYAYSNGLEMEIIRRVGAIYFRDICLGEFGMNPADIDNHATANSP